MICARLHQWLNLMVYVIILLKADGAGIPITYLPDAVAKGAVCLDGGPPAYHFEKGTGDGIDNWIVLIEGGGWCETVDECIERTQSEAGSSKLMVKEYGFGGILGGSPALNPDFFDWNRVKVRYCDGSSFTGDVEAVNPVNNLHFRGHRIFEFIINDLLAKGMKNAKKAMLTGCSAGGLASILNCDKFRAMLPATAKVKCVSDGGFFIHTKDISGGSAIEEFFTNVTKLHGSVKNLPASCTSKMKERPELCFFPQYVVQTMTTPIFFVNSAYDYWQLKNVLAPSRADKNRTLVDCKLDFAKCTPDQLKIVQGFRDEFLKALNIAGVANSTNKGMFIDSCYAHCQTGMQTEWSADISPVVNQTKIAKAVGDWYYDRSPAVKLIDCAYPCNPTCPVVDVPKVRNPTT